MLVSVTEVADCPAVTSVIASVLIMLEVFLVDGSVDIIVSSFVGDATLPVDIAFESPVVFVYNVFTIFVVSWPGVNTVVIFPVNNVVGRVFVD